MTTQQQIQPSTGTYNLLIYLKDVLSLTQRPYAIAEFDLLLTLFAAYELIQTLTHVHRNLQQ